MEHIQISSVITRLGTVIVLPVIFLVPIGVFIDRTYEILPLVTLGSLVVSAAISTVWVIRIVQEQ